MEDFTRNGVLLNLSATDQEGLVGDKKVGGSLGCNDHEIVEFSIGQEGHRAASSRHELQESKL